MEIQFEHANPDSGHESFLLRFNRPEGENICVLIDSGRGVDTADLVGRNERLAAVLLTHAHSDHIESLPENIDARPDIYASPQTAASLHNSLKVHDKVHEYDREAINELLNPIEDTVHISPQIRVQPLPAGHIPGGTAYLISAIDQGEERRLLVTGDFSFNPVAGNPGLPEQFPLEIDIVFVNASFNRGDRSVSEDIAEALSKSVSMVRSMGPGVIAASGYAGVHLAYLLGSVLDRAKRSSNIAVVGNTAKLYESLDFSFDSVTAISSFEHPSDILNEYDLCIAAPERAGAGQHAKYSTQGASRADSNSGSGSSSKLYSAIKDDNSAKLLQLTTGGSTRQAVRANCDIEQVGYTPHPEKQTVHEMITNILPIELIICHGNTEQYGEVFDFCMTWTHTDKGPNTVYKDGQWKVPYWIHDSTWNYLRTQHGQHQSSLSDADAEEVFNINRQVSIEDEVDLDDIVRRVERRGNSLALTEPASESISDSDSDSDSDSEAGAKPEAESPVEAGPEAEAEAEAKSTPVPEADATTHTAQQAASASTTAQNGTQADNTTVKPVTARNETERTPATTASEPSSKREQHNPDHDAEADETASPPVSAGASADTVEGFSTQVNDLDEVVDMAVERLGRRLTGTRLSATVLEAGDSNQTLLKVNGDDLPDDVEDQDAVTIVVENE